MLTLFTIPKSFQSPHISLIQRNSIQSWLRLAPRCEVILFGDDDGIAETAEEFGLEHIAGIKRNEYRTPILSEVFEQAQEIALMLLFQVHTRTILLYLFDRRLDC